MTLQEALVLPPFTWTSGQAERSHDPPGHGSRRKPRPSGSGPRSPARRRHSPTG